MRRNCPASLTARTRNTFTEQLPSACRRRQLFFRSFFIPANDIMQESPNIIRNGTVSPRSGRNQRSTFPLRSVPGSDHGTCIAPDHNGLYRKSEPSQSGAPGQRSSIPAHPPFHICRASGSCPLNGWRGRGSPLQDPEHLPDASYEDNPAGCR